MAGRQSQDAAALRAALIEQLAHLLREVEALQQVIDIVPEPLQTARPLPEEPSVRETYGMLVAADERVFLPAVQAFLTGQARELELPDDDALRTVENWNTYPLPAILKRLQQVRRELVALLQQAPSEAWDRTASCEEETWDLYQYAYFIIQHDTELLRALAYRLHAAYLPGKPRPVA
ncbi:DinB family protein [Rhodothermus profundi]|uniref:DinB superfamily protein n=1 Tax=Rhodothermus profundi TaxID=633813 RepID=A0A1M6VYE5_9BACT|nr:DinB family protein [Rhodothermus profundi]SHK86467.1 DinB superfamily protein [Rhodothermus profundi]